MLKKRAVIAQRIERCCHIFRCPVCGEAMYLDNFSLICHKRHTFDLSSRGYLNLLLRPVQTRYDTAMLTARQQLCQNGFFAPLIEALHDLILQTGLLDTYPLSLLLDAGCGEGSHLAQLVEALEQSRPQRVQGVGLDISKDGIRLAARDAWNIIWCVANLSQLPIQDRQCLIVTNILSPANYGEFTRVLMPDGMLVKVAPGERHLEELRALVRGKSEKSTTPPERIIHHFETAFTLHTMRQITYTVPLLPEHVPQVLTMTPLSWNITEAHRTMVLKTGLTALTVDVHLLLGKPVTASRA